MRIFRTIALIISLGVLVFSLQDGCTCPSCSFSSAKSVLACCGGPLEGTNGIALRVEGLKSPEDANKVESALKNLLNVMEAHVYIEKNEVAITLSSSISEEALIRCIKQAGFNASLPSNLSLSICSVDDHSNPESLRDSLNELLGVIVKSVDFEQKQLSIYIYKPWVQTAKRLINAIEDSGSQLCLPKETFVLKAEGMTTVDAFDARAYVQLLFGVVSANVEPDEGLLKVVIYKELACLEDIVRTIEERGFTKVLSVERLDDTDRKEVVMIR